MRVLIYGAGSVGSYYGARMARGGAEVFLLSRGAHHEAMKRDGLTIVDADGRWSATNVFITNRIDDVAPVDVIILAVKLYDLAHAAREALAVLAADGIVVPIQNGVESGQIVSQVVKKEQIVVGSVLTNISFEQPGVVKHVGANRLIQFGAHHSHLERLCRICTNGGLQAQMVTDAKQMLWKKFCRLATNSGISCLTRHALAQVRDVPEIRSVMQQAIAETVAVARASGVELDAGIETEILAGLDALPASSKSSMLLDLEAGRRLELYWLSGAVHRFGCELGVATPIHSSIFAALLPFANGASRQ